MVEVVDEVGGEEVVGDSVEDEEVAEDSVEDEEVVGDLVEDEEVAEDLVEEEVQDEGGGVVVGLEVEGGKMKSHSRAFV